MNRFVVLLLLLSTIIYGQALEIGIFPDSILAEMPASAAGINVNYLMDGGRTSLARISLSETLKDMGVRYLRYPGGEKSDLYMFCPPPYDHSEPTVTRTVGLDQYPGMFNPDGTLVYDPLDFDEFMELCREVEAEPIIVVAADRYMLPIGNGERPASRDRLIEHAAAWVRYANIERGYGIKYWMVGNETWNDNNPGSTAHIYARDVRDFSVAMKAVDPSILIIANGEKEEYFGTIITEAGDCIDRLCVSNYGCYDFISGYASYETSDKCLIYPAMTAINALNRFATSIQRERLRMIVAEYGTIDWFGNWDGVNDMGHAIATFDMTGQLFNQPQIEFSCFWNTRWIENIDAAMPHDHDALAPDGTLYPTGMALKMFNMYRLPKVVACTSAGAVKSFATVDKEKNIGTLLTLNKGLADVDIILTVAGGKPRVYRHYEYYGTSPNDMKPCWGDVDLSENSKVCLRPYSINVITFAY